jgi:hypothetical protein
VPLVTDGTPPLTVHPDRLVQLCSYGRKKANLGGREKQFDFIIDCAIPRYNGLGSGDRDEGGTLGHPLDTFRINRCSGHNGLMMLVTSEHPFFPGILQRLKHAIYDWVQSSKRSFRVGLRCERGRHRSVAITNLVYECLVADGIPVHYVHMDTHVNSERPPCGCPDNCAFILATEVVEQYKCDRERSVKNSITLWRDAMFN